MLQRKYDNKVKIQRYEIKTLRSEFKFQEKKDKFKMIMSYYEVYQNLEKRPRNF